MARYLRGETQAVHMPPCVHVVQGVENKTKALEVLNAELSIFDISMVVHDVNIRIECRCCGGSDLGLRLTNVFGPTSDMENERVQSTST